MQTANRNATLILGLALLGLIAVLAFMIIRLQLRLNRMDREAQRAGLVEDPSHCTFCGTRLSPHIQSRMKDRCISCAAKYRGQTNVEDKTDEVDIEKQNARQVIYEVRD